MVLKLVEGSDLETLSIALVSCINKPAEFCVVGLEEGFEKNSDRNGVIKYSFSDYTNL